MHGKQAERGRRLGLSLFGLWLLGGLAGCEALVYDNPRNCVRNQNACTRDERCNLETQRCESLDCTSNLGLCSAAEFCDGLSHRCTKKTCVIDAALCTATQECNRTTGECQTRSFVLGQPDDSSNQNAAFGLNSPWSTEFIADAASPGSIKIAVADTGNGRVLIWNDIPTQNRPADAVLGLPDVHTLAQSGTYGGVTERSLSTPWSIASDGSRLMVADQIFNRVLSWIKLPTRPSGGEPIAANRLWGQTTFELSQPDSGQDTPNPLGVSKPRISVEHPPLGTGRFFIADLGNHRVLSFPAIPETPTVKPDFVIGQPDFTQSLPGGGATTLNTPRAAVSDGNQLYVADFGNHRVVTYTLPLASNGPSANTSLIFGQANLTAIAPNRGLGMVNRDGLNRPASLAVIGTAPRLVFIVDQVNNRVLRYTLPSTSADLVLGQADFSSGLPNRGGPPSASTLFQPLEVTTDGTRLAIVDNGNHRVLVWRSLPTTSGQPADLVLGQPDAISSLPNNPPTRSGLQFRAPSFVATDGKRLAVADFANHRVLLWNQLPQSGKTAPDVILGQADATGIAANAGLAAPTAATLNGPNGVDIDGDRLVVADTHNHRVLIWTSVPTQNMAPADFVIGQPSFTSLTSQPPATGLNFPFRAQLSDGTLYVADTGYNRVLFYKNPLRSGATADLVLGQPTLVTIAPNQGGQSAKSLFNPYYVYVNGGKLFVADRGNNRVLLWNSIPTANFQNANLIIGQTDFATSYTRNDRTRIAFPRGILVHNGRLYISSGQQNRILYWNQIPTENGARADGVLGQPDFLASLPNNFDLPWLERLSLPGGLTAAADQLFLVDTANSRLVVRETPQ